MFNSKILILLFFLSLAFLSACAHPTTSYQINASNTAQLSSFKGSASQKISVGEISKVASRIDMKCRMGDITFDANESIESYIRNALVDELKAANIYSESSNKQLKSNIDSVSLSTFHAVELITPAAQQFLDSKWNITMTFNGGGIDSFTIPSIYLFPTREGFFDAVCENPRKKFSEAVGNLIKILFKHPSFISFLNEDKK